MLFLTSALAQQPAPIPLSRLQASIERITKSINADWGLYIKCLETGEEIAIDADHQMDTMSVINIGEIPSDLSLECMVIKPKQPCFVYRTRLAFSWSSMAALMGCYLADTAIRRLQPSL
jgi:hypothetical protein